METDKTLFGFWVYLMTDLLMFAALFAAFLVLRGNTFGQPSEDNFINLPFVFVETLFLLTSSFTIGLAMLQAEKKRLYPTLVYTGITFVLGISFLGMEIFEFTRLFAEGHGFDKSASLSAFFTLVGTHGMHIAVGLLWMALLIVFLMKRGLTDGAVRKLTLLGLFWHFLDIVWIFIFTVVYLMGAAL